MHKEIRASQVSIIFRDFIFEYQMISERIPGKIGYQTMILVQIRSIVRKYYVRRDLSLKPFEIGLDLTTAVWQVAVSEVFDYYRFSLRLFLEGVCTLFRLSPSSLTGAKYYPV